MTAKWLLAASVFCLSALGVVGCSQQPPSTNLEVEGQSVAACNDQRADTDFLRLMREGDISLRKAIKSGGANAVAEAHKALDQGDFRLIAEARPEGLVTEPYGVSCRVLGGLMPWSVRAIGFAEGDGETVEKRLPEDTTISFGRRYNAAVLSDPRFPYTDVCRAVDKAGPQPVLPNNPDEGIVQPYGFADLGVARMTHGLGAAARRGSVHDIKVLLDRGQIDINKPDMFGLTPLAWAVAYHRWPAAEALLEEKANPIGGACQSPIDRESPLQIARVMRWYGMIRGMRPLVTEEEFAMLRQKPRWTDSTLTEYSHTLTELKERYRGVLSTVPFARHDLYFDVDEKGNTVGCKIDPASISPSFDKEACGLAVEIVRWTPARDAFGTRVPESTKLLVGIGGK